ncbi:MAG TPA: CBS domain-containing protein [Conexivisphaerales archaeon]|nr:CBS domain-containing protein [Conexivisphaerales archaeon]
MALERRIPLKIFVRDVMNSPLVSGSGEDTVSALAKKMVEFKVGSVVIIDGDKVEGVVTDGDMVKKVVSENLKPSETKAKEIMSTPLYTIDASKEVTEAARMMRKLGIKRLGVVHRSKVVGIISMSDVLSVTPELVDAVSEKARILTGESRRTPGFVSGYCDTCNQWSDYLVEIDGRYICEECRSEVPEKQ